MGPSTKNYLLDVVMGLLATAVGVSAFMLWVVLPQGFFAARLVWLDIHKWTGLLLAVAVCLHVVFHWKWLVRTTRRLLTRVSRGAPASAPQTRSDHDRAQELDPERGWR